MIDHNKLSVVATSTFSSFPLLVSVTDSDLKSTGNGGKQASSTGVDILFTNSDGITKLNHEVETYASTTGQLIAWVKIPTLTSSSDYPIYIYFGNSNAADQSNATGVWDGNYSSVYHLNDNAANTTVKDSTGSFNGTNAANTSGKSVTGQIGKGLSYNGTTDNTSTANTSGYGDFTAEAWFTSNTTAAAERILDKSFSLGFWMGQAATPTNIDSWGGGIEESSSPFGTYITLQHNQWHQLVIKRSGTTKTTFGDGGAVSRTDSVSGTAMNNNPLYIGSTFNGGSPGNWFNGNVDEVRISNIARSNDWLTTEYNNMNSPSTFYAYGAVQTVTRQASGGAAAPALKVRGGVKFH